MRKIFTLLIAVVAISCSSPEKKSQKLINQYMFENLYDYSSYEPVLIEIDSALSSIYLDSTIRSYAISYVALNSLFKESMEEMDEAMEQARICVNNPYDYQFDRYLEQAKEAKGKAEFYLKKKKGVSDTIKILANDYEPKFIGWNVKHKFRCKTKGGDYDLCNYTFIMDEEFKEIVESINEDDEGLAKINMAIKDIVSEPADSVKMLQ